MKSYFKYYWLYLISFVTIPTILKYLFSIEVDNFPIFYMVFVWFPIMIIGLIETCRLSNYISKNHRQKYKELTSSPNNYWYFINWDILSSANDFDDENITFLKQNCKKMIKLTIIAWICFLVFCILL